MVALTLEALFIKDITLVINTIDEYRVGQEISEFGTNWVKSWDLLGSVFSTYRCWKGYF